MNAAQLRIRNRMRALEARHSITPDMDAVMYEQRDIEQARDARRAKVSDLVHEFIVIDPIEDETLDGGRMTCTRCGLSSDHDSMGAAGAAGWAHVQECGEQT